MEYWWKENKTFVIPVGGMLLAVLLWHWLILSGIRADAVTVQRKRQMAETQLRAKMAAGVPSEDAVTRGKRDIERSKKLVDELKKELGLVRSDAYKPGTKPANEFFISFKEDVRKKIADKASTSGVGVPENALGFPTMSDSVSPELGDELLGRLAMIEKLALFAIDAGVTRIETVSATVGMDGEATEATGRKDAFLNRLTVRMRVIGPSKAVFQWLWKVQKKNDFMAVDEFKTEKTNPHEDVFAAEMEVSGLIINVDGALVPAKE